MNFANSRRNRDSVMREPKRFEELTDWRLNCRDQVEELQGRDDQMDRMS